MAKLRISETVSLDLLRLVDSRLLIQANSGGGKSWMLRLIAEQAAGHVQTIILDPEGEFATLRERFDFLLAGEGGEIPVDPRSAALLSRRLIELQASAVVDLYSLKLSERRRFVRLFLESLMHLPKQLWRPVVIMLDEAHLFCPERSAGDAESTDAVIDLMSQGRKRSYCGILATQRLSKLHKDAEAETNNVFIGRTWLDIDQKRAGALLGFGKEQSTSLRDLDPGEFFGFGPALIADEKGIARFKAAPVQTTHPKAGQRHKLTPPKPSEAVRRIVSDLKDLPEQAEAEIRDLADAKKKIGELQRELRARPTDKQTVEVEKLVEVPVLKNGQLERTEKIAARMIEVSEKFGESARQLCTTISPAFAKPVPQAQSRQPVAAAVAKRPSTIPNPITPKMRQPAKITQQPTDGEITGPMQRILDAIAWCESIGIAQPQQPAVAGLAGYTYGGGGFNNPRGALRTAGLVDYVPGDRIQLTDAGRAQANVPDSPLTSAEMQSRVLGVLGGPEQKILSALIEIYPHDIDKDELAKRAGYSPGSGGFNNPMGRLRTLGFADYPTKGRAVALPLLFPA